MEIRYSIDADTTLPHIYGHGVTETEVEQILKGRGDDVAGQRATRIKIGRTAAGRILKVIYSPDEDDPKSVFVITAYELKGKSKRAFRRRQRRRPQ